MGKKKWTKEEKKKKKKKQFEEVARAILANEKHTNFMEERDVKAIASEMAAKGTRNKQLTHQTS